MIRIRAAPQPQCARCLWVQLWLYCEVEFSWRESKREWVRAERGIDFLRSWRLPYSTAGPFSPCRRHGVKRNDF